MFRSCRCVIVAALGWLTLCAQHPKPQPESVKAQAQRPISAAPASISTANDNLSERTKRAPQRGPCGPERYLSDNDLCAQWKAADAAHDAARWGFGQFLIGGIGLIVGGATLYAAMMAARYAKQAAYETQRGANAAEKAIEVTREIGEAQVRAYVSVDKAVIEFEQSGAILVQFTASNSGQSPAQHVKYDCRVAMKEVNSGTAWKSPEIDIRQTTANISLAANEYKDFTVVKAELLQSINIRNSLVDANLVNLDLIIDIQWKDVFNSPFEERYRFFIDFKPADNFRVPISTKRYTALSEDALREFGAGRA